MRRQTTYVSVLLGIIFLSIVLGRVSIAYGTDVNPADGIVKGTWKIIESPFHIKRDITVPTDDSLTIEPGVVVYFDGYFNLTVRGKLLAAGTAGNRITFSWKDGGTDRDKWVGIYLYSATKASTISYCIIMNAKAPINAYGSFNNIFTFNTIRYNTAGILVSAAEGNTISDNEIYENSDFGICVSQGCQRTEISRNVIYKIGPPVPPYDRGDAIIIRSYVGSPMNIDNKIRDNTIYNCHFSAIKVDHVQNLEITGNLMYANYQRGVNGTGGNIYIKMTGDTFLDYENKDILIHNNRVHSAAGNGTGVFMQSARNVRMTFNDIYLNAFAGIVVLNVTTLCQINRNNIRNNARHEAWDNGVTMAWDDGSRGNYWGNYTGFDYNNDGIGDVPYTLDGPKNSKDFFPLVHPQLFIVTTVSTTTTRTSSGTLVIYTTTTSWSTLSTWSATITVVPGTSTTFVHTVNATTTTTTTSTTAITYTLSIFTFYATSTSYIWTASASTTTTYYSTSYTGTTATTTTTSTSTTTSTTSTTTTATATRTITPGRCLIASAAYESELSPAVQYLRDFRDGYVSDSFAGSEFLRLFNTFYYSFSPFIADSVSASETAKAATRIALVPLLTSLYPGQAAFHMFRSQPELGVLLAGLVSSSLMGILYASPLVAFKAIKAKTERKKGGYSLKPLAIVWIGSLLALATSYVFLYAGQEAIADFIAMVSSGTLVLATVILAPLLLLKLIRRFLP